MSRRVQGRDKKRGDGFAGPGKGVTGPAFVEKTEAGKRKHGIGFTPKKVLVKTFVEKSRPLRDGRQRAAWPGAKILRMKENERQHYGDGESDKKAIALVAR
jgi:hypothetical protein